MFVNFFYLLRGYGVPVSITEWMTLMEALSRGMAYSSLSGFYHLARAILVKSETYYDKYDLAFQHYFDGIESSDELTERVMKWLENALPPLHISPEERKQFQDWDLEELRKRLEERMKEQDGEHHGGSKWIGTGGRSPFGHSGHHPAGVRIGGESVNKSAVKVAGERKFKGFRTDETIGVRQFEVALRKLRQLTSKDESPKEELNIEETIQATADKGGLLELIWDRGRKNDVKVALMMDSGGSMLPYMRICSQLFTAINKATHFRDLRFYYFHNCIYENIFLDPSCSPRNSIKTEHLLHQLDPEYKVIIVGDASMAPSELTMVGGAIDWSISNNEPGIYWLQRIASHFDHSIWLNPIPSNFWSRTIGSYSISLIRDIFPMYELTLEGLDLGIKKLKVKR